MIAPSKLKKFKPDKKDLERLSNEFFSEALPLLEKIYNSSCWIFMDEKSAFKISKQAFSEAVEYCNVTKNEADWQSWIYRIWMREINDYFAQRENDIKTNFEFIDYANIELNESAIIFDESKSLLTVNELKNLIQKLPALLRIPLIMKEVLLFSYEKIAELIDVPEGVIATRIYRARKLLFLLSKKDFDLDKEKIFWNEKEPTKKIFELRESSLLVDNVLNQQQKHALNETLKSNSELQSEIILQKSIKNILQTKIPTTVNISSLKSEIERKAKKKFK